MASVAVAHRLDKTKALRVATIQQVLTVSSAAVLVDHVPVGVWGELLLCLKC